MDGRPDPLGGPGLEERAIAVPVHEIRPDQRRNEGKNDGDADAK